MLLVRGLHCVVRVEIIVFFKKQVWIILSKYHSCDRPFQIIPLTSLGFRGTGLKVLCNNSVLYENLTLRATSD